jgi:hypothetical protein
MRSANNNFQEGHDDDLDSPTEPMMRIVLAPHLPPSSPFQSDISSAQTAPLQAVAPLAPAPVTPAPYPVLPPVTHLNGSSPGEVNGSAMPVMPGRVARVAPHRSMVPDIVGVCFVAVQVLLLARVVLLLFNVGSNPLWAQVCYTASSVFALPFRTLFEHIQPVAQLGSGVIAYLAPLVAILVYGLISRILVRFLKALLNSR